MGLLERKQAEKLERDKTKAAKVAAKIAAEKAQDAKDRRK